MLLDIYLLNVDKTMVSKLRPVTTLDTYTGATKNFHPDGFYSPEIFGPVGSPNRDKNFSYIDAKADIISPIVALTLFELKQLYKGIMSGTAFATWNEESKDFDSAKQGDPGASTGYSFFVKHFHELTPKENHSQNRQQSIDFFYKFREYALSKYVLVFPAGLRDMQVDDAGEKEHELTPLYRSVMTVTKTIPDRGVDSPLMDIPRWKLQKAFIDVYEYFFNFIDGKKGFTRGKVTSRRLTDGTRNVLSPLIANSTEMGAVDQYRPTDTMVGLHQGLRSILPVTQHHVRTRYLGRADAGQGHMNLINPKTLETEYVKVNVKDYDLFTTDEGIEKLLHSFKVPQKRHSPLKVGDNYIALVYRKKDKFKVFYDIKELPDGFDKKHVSPITLAELLYLSGYDIWGDYFMFVTRYPVAGSGSTYPSTMRVETTVKSDVVYEYNEDWETVKEIPAISYPRKDVEEFISAMAPHPTRLSGLQGDFDGDTGSGNSIYTEEALKEQRYKMTTISYWIDVNLKLKIDLMDGTSKRTFKSLMKDPE